MIAARSAFPNILRPQQLAQHANRRQGDNQTDCSVKRFPALFPHGFPFLGLTPCPFAAGGRYSWPPPGLDERNANLLGLPPNEPTLPHRLAGNREFK
jgi:hypothetical protein